MFHSTLQALDVGHYQSLRAGATVLEADSFGDKVLRLADGAILKLFRRKRLFSSALFHPYARSFVDNIRGLRARGIECPQVINAYHIADIARDAVHYRPLAGETLRRIIAASTPEAPHSRAELAQRLGKFVARLHEDGVYFRSLHLGNVVLTPAGELGLIDISDLRFRHPPLRASLRQRNFRHLLRAANDRDWLMQDDGAAFCAGYLAGSAALSAGQMAPVFSRPYFYIVYFEKSLCRSKSSGFMDVIEKYNFSTGQWDALAAQERLRVQDEYWGYEPGDPYSFGGSWNVDAIEERQVARWIKAHTPKPATGA
ncbi:MAG: lipopolysaccharide kinase InaA family protein [Zoogloeaceae bacterium]|jgi:tRNA A-37 threonylcarbamoyl transferase component Bud32|nr:lipopolysaccharide kinase InaA family protein [Zoogloeaceae bacterium]